MNPGDSVHAPAPGFEQAREAFLAGSSAYQTGEFEAAAAHFEAALAALPGRVSTLVNLAATRLKLGQPEPALTLLDQAVAQADGHADAHGHRGSALALLGRNDEALAAFERAIDIAGSGAEAGGAEGEAVRGGAMAQRALLLLALGRPAEALAQLDALPAGPASSAETCWHRGRALQALERSDEAEAAYRRALTIDPHLAGAWGHLGGLLKDAGQTEEAIDCLRRAHTLEPDEPVHTFLLAALGAAPAPAVPPAHYVRALFDGYAEGFDEHLVHTLHYRAPQQLAGLLGEHLAAGKHAQALDLGCGTGLLGPLLAPWVATLDGVDLSPRMLAAARERGVYRHLHEAELVEFLERPASRAAYDVLAATDVLIYLGDLAPLFSAAALSLRAGGLFAFSVERLDDAGGASDRGTGAPGWALRRTSRYAHCRRGLERWATAAGLEWVADRSAALREEQGRPVEGLTVLLRRAPD